MPTTIEMILANYSSKYHYYYCYYLMEYWDLDLNALEDVVDQMVDLVESFLDIIVAVYFLIKLIYFVDVVFVEELNSLLHCNWEFISLTK